LAQRGKPNPGSKARSVKRLPVALDPFSAPDNEHNKVVIAVDISRGLVAEDL